MNIAALAARSLLALVFVVAGVAKLTDRKGSRQVLVEFGFPAAFASPLAIVLPLAELAVAASLLPPATASWGALGALSLLLVFMGGIGISLARGRKPDCHCFGQLHSGPAGWKTLARNGALAAIAGFLLWQGDVGPSAVGWAGGLSTAQQLGLVGGVLALPAGFLVHRLWRNGGFAEGFAGGAAAAQNDVSSLPAGYRRTCGKAHPNGVQQATPAVKKIGEPAPKIEFYDPSGKPVNLWSIKGEETIVLFHNPDCAFCQQMLPDLKQWEERPPEGAPEMLVISAGAENTGLGSPVLFDRSFAVFREFGAGETPSAVLVDAEGKVASGLALGAPEVLELAGGPRHGSRAGRTPRAAALEER